MESWADVVLSLEDRGVTRKAIAAWGDVDARTVGYWIEGVREPSLVVLRRLLTRGNDVVKAGVFAFLTRGTGLAVVPVAQAEVVDAMRAAAAVATETAQLIEAVATGQSQERVESEAADVVRAASAVPGARNTMRITPA